MNNYEKYIKYKKKYLELKKELIIGGSGNYQLPIPKKISTNYPLQIPGKISTNYPLLIPEKISTNYPLQTPGKISTNYPQPIPEKITNINTKPTLFLPNKPAEKVSETRYIRPNNDKYVKTEYNSGKIEGMSNQCFWISIQQFLRNNGYPNLTVREIRRNAGLDINTENIMFDSEIEVFRKAAEAITRNYNLTINIVPVNSHGQVLYGGEIIERIGKGSDNVNIAQFGTYHFQLITNDVNNPAESNFIPAVVIDNNIVDINYNNLSDINEEKLNIKIMLTDLELEIKSYKNTLESFRSDYLNYKQLKEQSTDPKEIDNITNMARELEKLYKETETKLKECENTKLDYEYILNEL